MTIDFLLLYLCSENHKNELSAVSFAKGVIPVTAMEDVSPPDMEGKTIALTSCTIANEARDVVEPDVTLHWNDLGLSTDSTEALAVRAKPSSNTLTSPWVQRVDVVKKGAVMSSTTKVPSTV